MLIISLLLELFEKDFSFDSVFAFLKTGFLDIDMKEIYELENYVLKRGVHGYSWWSKPFKGSDKGLNQINKTRQKFIDLIKDIYPVFSNDVSQTNDYIRALYDFMSEQEFGKKLWYKSSWFEEAGDLRRERVYENAYEKFLMVLDKTIDIVGNRNISRKTLEDMLITGMSDMKLGILPSTLDQVIIGDMEKVSSFLTGVL